MWGELALETQADYLAHLATAGVAEVRRDDGLLAVVTGVFSNTENGVVADEADDATIAELLTWFEARRAPGSWIALAPQRGLAERLERAGCRPERTGVEMGARLDALELEKPDGIEVVADERALDDWLEVAEACSLLAEPGDREARRRLALSLGLGGERPVVSYLARRGGHAVGLAQAFFASRTVSLLHVAVLEGERRGGIGRALALARLCEARRRGYETVVLAPSAEGEALYHSLGFGTSATPADRCFYLPLSGEWP